MCPACLEDRELREVQRWDLDLCDHPSGEVQACYVPCPPSCPPPTLIWKPLKAQQAPINAAYEQVVACQCLQVTLGPGLGWELFMSPCF